MSYQITCPYCFKSFTDEAVLFRSAYVADKQVEDDIAALLPMGYVDLGDFEARYHGNDKAELLNQYRELEFFVAKEDKTYEDFWAKFNGTTEHNAADEKLGVETYYRPIIDPKNPDHQQYLELQEDGGYFIYDPDGMAVQIKLKRGERCSKRVCPHCHNPLPEGYGKTPAKFVSVIGITGAGKTVYLSQLLKHMPRYATKAGLTATKNPSVREFVKNNSIEADKPLPGPTPFNRFQQPLFFDLSQRISATEHRTETLVLYDVPGEALAELELVEQFAYFVTKSHGAILLLDPMQFDDLHELSPKEKKLEDATTVLDTLYKRIVPGANAKCTIPFAICLAQADRQVVLDAFLPELREAVGSDYEGVKGSNGGFCLPQFNATQYNPIFRGLFEFLQEKCPQLSQMMYDNFATYGYFALSALGCDVKIEKKKIESDLDELVEIEQKCPVGPVVPKRVEEPLLWLLYQLGCIGVTDGGIADVTAEPITCPTDLGGCDSNQVVRLPAGSTLTVEEGRWPFKRKKTVQVNCECRNCGMKWLRLDDQ